MTNSADNLLQQADDLDAMKEVFGGDFAELAVLFQTDSPKRIEALHRAVAEGRYGDITPVVHALSGSAASMGAASLALACRNLEEAVRSGRAGETADIVSKIKEIETDYAKICERLRLMLP